MWSEHATLLRDAAQTHKIECLTDISVRLAHDYNNFLAAIHGNAVAALEHLPADSEPARRLRQIEMSADQAVALTRGILLYSGRADLDLRPLRLSHVIDAERQALAGLAAGTTSLGFDLAVKDPTVRADFALMGQLVRDLIENAVEALVDARGTVTVSTGARRCDRELLEETYLPDGLAEGEYAFVRVTDDGRGMAPDVQARMFDPLFTTKMRRPGLGLARVLGIVRAHGGTLHVSSRPDMGTAVTVLFRTDDVPVRPPR